MAEICPVLLITLLLHLYRVPSGFSQLNEETEVAEEDESFGGTFSLKDYSSWLNKHKIHLFNYAAEVNETVVIWSPILPVPKGLHWSSLNMENELPASASQKLGLAYSRYFDKFLKTFNKSWARVFTFDRQNKFLRIEQTDLGYADVYRLHLDENRKNSQGKKTSSIDQDFDVAITLMTYMNHECELKARPQNPKHGDTLILSCSVVVNGLWNASLVFRNSFDGSEIRGEVSDCSRQPRVGSRICSTIRLKVETDILAYTCSLEFSPDQRENPRNPMFQNSKWTARFNKEVVCYFPKIYIETIPSEVSFLCNNMPCGDAVEVNDKISCVAYGYPQPVFDLQITKESSGAAGYKEDSEELKELVEHVEKIEKYLDEGGDVKYSLEYSARMLLSVMIKESILLEKMGIGEEDTLGKDEQANMTQEALDSRSFSEMIDAILKNVRAFGHKLDGNNATAAPENDSLQEISLEGLNEAVTELESEIRAVGDKLREKPNNIPPDVESDQLKKLENIITALLSIVDILKNMLTEDPVPEHDLTNDEEREENYNKLLDEVHELTAEFKDAHNVDIGLETVKQIYKELLKKYEFPGLGNKSHIFMDSDEEPDPDGNTSSLGTVSPQETAEQSEETESTSEPDSPSSTEELAASTEESPASSSEAGNDTVTDSVEEKGDDVIPDNTTDAGNVTKDFVEDLHSNATDAETDEPPYTTGLPELTDVDVAEQRTTSEGRSDASDSSEVELKPKPEEKEVNETENGGENGDKVEEKEQEREEEKEEQQEWTEERNELVTVAGESPTREADNSGEPDHDEDSEMTSVTFESVEQAIKSLDEYRFQTTDVGHVEVSCNVSNALGWAYNSMPLQVTQPRVKPVLSTVKPTQPDEDKQTASLVENEEESTEPDEESSETDEEPAEPDEEPGENGEEVTEEISPLETLDIELGVSETTVDNKEQTRFPVLEGQENGIKKIPESEEDFETKSSGDGGFETTFQDAPEAGAAAGGIYVEQNAEVNSKNPDEGRAGGNLIPNPNEIPGAQSGEFDKTKNTQSTAGHHVRSIFLELFLLVSGVLLTQVEL